MLQIALGHVTFKTVAQGFSNTEITPVKAGGNATLRLSPTAPKTLSWGQPPE